MINKIVSTSVFGTDERYIVGAKRQVFLASHYYPNWEFRIYTDNPENFIDCPAKIIHIKDGTQGTFWRFFPLFESDSNITIVRDADSRITAREVMAVYEWMMSDKAIHVIKDHETHNHKPILAGMVGVKGKLDQKCLQDMVPYLYGEKRYGKDEEYLENCVYPSIKEVIYEHHYSKGWFGLSRNFLKNKYEFVGQGYYLCEKPIYGSTVEETRSGFDGRKLPDEFKFSSYPWRFE